MHHKPYGTECQSPADDFRHHDFSLNPQFAQQILLQNHDNVLQHRKKKRLAEHGIRRWLVYPQTSKDDWHNRTELPDHPGPQTRSGFHNENTKPAYWSHPLHSVY